MGTMTDSTPIVVPIGFQPVTEVPFPKVHDLIALKGLCVEEEGVFELVHDLLGALEGYDVAIRYPGEAATVEDARKAVAAMKKVRKFVRARLGNPSR